MAYPFQFWQFPPIQKEDHYELAFPSPEGKPAKRKRKTPAQKKAMDAYKFAERQEDRYLGSVFANLHGQRLVEAKTAAAYAECKRLGMTHEHGL